MGASERAGARTAGAPNRGGRLARACLKRFLAFYPDGFYDEDYVAMERLYKVEAHERWRASLGRERFAEALERGAFDEIARTAVAIESRTNLLFSFEKMAIRDAVREPAGAEAFAYGIYAWLYGFGSERERFERWIEVVDALPRRQTRVLTWPVVTVFGFIARPKVHLFVKPNVTRRAAAAYGYDFTYRPRPSWDTYDSALGFVRTIRKDLHDRRPRDMIDLQSFIWVQGSSEYD